MVKRKIFALFVLSFVLLPPLAVQAQTPTSSQIPFTGQVTPGLGLEGTTQDITFKFYDAQPGGNPLPTPQYTDRHAFVPIDANGVFTEVLSAPLPTGDGESAPTTTFNPTSNPAVSVWVASELTRSPGTEIALRVPIYSSGYAHFAQKVAQGPGSGLDADTLHGPNRTAFAPVPGSPNYVAKAGDTMTGALNLPANGLVAGTNQLVLSGGNVGIGTAAPNEQLEITGNLRLPPSTATAGVIKSGANRFIHNFGPANFFAGVNAGNLSLTGNGNTGVGVNALQSLAAGSFNTAVGINALFFNGMGKDNTAVGTEALRSNTMGLSNTAVGVAALESNSAGFQNTAVGVAALFSNTTGFNNTTIGNGADVSVGNLTNATAIGARALVDASNKIRLGNSAVTVIEAQVGLTVVSDRTKKENFLPMDGEEVLEKIRGLTLSSWNYTGQDSKQFRHYGPNAQEFFAAFGYDGIGTSGTSTTINSGDMAGIMMVAIQALERRTQVLKEKEAEITDLKARLEALEGMVRNISYQTAWSGSTE